MSSICHFSSFLLFVAFELTSFKWCKRKLQIIEYTTVEWNLCMKYACVDALEKRGEKRKIGGDGLIEKIDESLFTKQKNNADRMPPPQWIYGGLCRETNDCFFILVCDRSAATLINAIEGDLLLFILCISFTLNYDN